MVPRSLFPSLLVTSALLFASAASAEPAGSTRVQQLPNGLRVVLAVRPDASDVSVAVRYEAGRRDVPSGLEGLTAITAKLVLDGTKHLPRGASTPVLESAGASAVSWQTTMAGTELFETVPPGALDLALWVESERMGFPLDGIDAATFDAVKKEWCDRQRAALHRSLASLDRFMADALRPAWHPFHDAPRATDGTGVTLADARAFVTTWYAPHNATIAIAGNFDPAHALATLDRLFGSIPDRPTPPRPPLPPFDSPRVPRTFVGAKDAFPAVRLAWITPALDAPGDADLDFLARIMERHLRRVLVDHGDLRSVSAVQESQREAESSTFSIDVVGQPMERPEDILAVVDEELARVPLDAAALARARATWQTSELLELESTLGLARRLAAHPERAAQQISPLDPAHAKVTTSSLRETMRTVLSPRRRAEILVRKIYDEPTEGAEIGPLNGERRPGDRR